MRRATTPRPLAAECRADRLAEEIQADADSAAYRAGGRAFLLERYCSIIAAALGRGRAGDRRPPSPRAATTPVIDLPPAAASGRAEPRAMTDVTRQAIPRATLRAALGARLAGSCRDRLPAPRRDRRR